MANNGVHRSGDGSAHERSLQDYLAIILRGKWIVFGVFLAVLGATILFTKIVDPVYKASAQVLLNTKELQSTIFLDAVRPDGVKNITQNELAILSSTSLTDTVAQRLIDQRYLEPETTRPIPITLVQTGDGSSDSIAPLKEVSGLISEVIDFDPVRESDVITISAKSKDPVEAALIANTFAESYRDRNVYMSRAKTRSFREFLDQQAASKKKELSDIEDNLQAYMEKQGIVSLDEESKNTIEKLSELEAQRDATEIELKKLKNTLASYQEQLPQQETNVARVMAEASDPYIRLLQEQIAKLEVQRDVTMAQNPTSVSREILNERVKEIESQIAQLTARLQKRTDTFLSNLTPQSGTGQDAASYLKSVKQKIIETAIEVQSLEAKKKALEEVIQQYERQFDRIPQKSLDLARLQRARTSDEKLYLMLQEKFNEANITEQSNIGYIEIIERASIPIKPSSPKLLINIAIGIVLGLGLGLVVVFVKEFLDVRIQSPEELKRHGYTPLAAVVGMDRELQKLTTGGGRIVGGETARKGLDPHLITYSYPFSSVAESYRQVRTHLQFARQGAIPRVVVVSSPAPGEGKSTTAANLAIAVAQNGRKVLLIDADLRKPSLDRLFGLKKEPGLSDLLTARVTLPSAIQKTVVENLSVMVCGTIPPNPAEVLGSEKMRALVEQARSDYDVVLFDSSPVLAVTDPAVLATLSDGVILVVSAGKTTLEELQHGVELVEAVGGKILGVILNNLDLKRAYGIAYRKARGGSYGGYSAKAYVRARSGQDNDGHGVHHKV
ncbi:MAG: capsular exopolysaccharide family [Bacteroidetes bacterium]|nr:capsular exopolysaccharide family [Bacteroidota bacterium]